MDKTYCLKHYRDTFPDKGCDICELEAKASNAEQNAKEGWEHAHYWKAENAKLKEAAKAVVEEKERLSTYLGGPVAIDELNKRISALAALVEGKQGG